MYSLRSATVSAGMPVRLRSKEEIDLVKIEDQIEQLYDELRHLLENNPDEEQLSSLRTALTDALEAEARVARTIAARRLPALERMQASSNRADELLRRYAQDPPTSD